MPAVFFLQKEIDSHNGTGGALADAFLQSLQAEDFSANRFEKFHFQDEQEKSYLIQSALVYWHFLRNQWKEVVGCWSKEFFLYDGLKNRFPLGCAELLLIWSFCSDLCGGAPFDVEFSRHWEGSVPTDIKKILTLEKAALLMSRGLYQETIVSLQQCTELPVFWTLRKTVLEGISAQALGDFERTRKALQKQKSEIETIALPALLLMWERRALGFEIERENYKEASARLHLIENEMLHNADPILKTLFYQEGILLALALNDRPVMEEFWKLSQANRKDMSGTFASLTEETCEASLLFDPPDQAAVLISDQIAIAQRRGQFNSLCVAQFGLARALALQNKLEEAAASAELALFVAEKHHFGRDRVRVLFLLFGLAIEQGNNLAAKQYLKKIESILETLSLALHRVLMHWARLFLGPLDPTSLKAVLECPLSWDQLQHWLHIYCIKGTFSLVFQGKNIELVSLKSMLVNEKRAFVLADCRQLIRWNKGQLFCSELGKNETDRVIWALALRGKKGLTLPEIHALNWKNVSFRQERHASACYVLISRCRARLRTWGFEIQLVQTSGQYLLVSKKGVPGLLREHSVAVALHATQGSQRTAPNRPLILAFLELNGPASGKRIAESLGVQRQSIHELLKNMVSANELRFQGKGRYSTYTLFK